MIYDQLEVLYLEPLYGLNVSSKVKLRIINADPPLKKKIKSFYINEIKALVKRKRIYTIPYLAKKINKNHKDPHVFKGQLLGAIEALEEDGYICFLPDKNGELQFCNYKYFKELR